MKKGLVILCAALVLPGLAGAADSACSEVVFRIWQDGTTTYYDHGTEVPIEVDREAHLYLHVQSKSNSPYSASAQIGYPREFGVDGPKPSEVLEVLGLRAQSTQDVRDGRIILSTKKVGRTQLGYRLLEVRHPGSIDQIPRRCRTGAVSLKINDGDVTNPKPPEEPQDLGAEAAKYLVANLYSGILRRKKESDPPEEHLRIAVERGQDGLRDLAADMLFSEEFRAQAFDRTIEAHDDLSTRSADGEILERLLRDIYRKLFGPNASLDEAEHRSHLDALDICLSSFSSREAACKRLGESLIDHPLYRRYHGSRLEALNRAADQPSQGWQGFDREVDERRQ